MPSALDRYRRPGGAPPSPAPAPPVEAEMTEEERDESEIYAWAGSAHYEAYKQRARPVRFLHILPSNDFWPSASYLSLPLTVEDGIHGTCLMLVFHTMMVTIRGRNLHQVAGLIRMGHCLAVRAFVPGFHRPPENPAAPFIEAITVVMEGLEEKMKQTQAKGKST